MSPRQNRPRRAVNSRKLAALRLAGWRYSTTREAYVHRLGGGKVGPVFVEVETVRATGMAVPDTTIFDALVAAKAPGHASTSLPTPTPWAIDVRDPLPARSAGQARPRIPVKVQLHANEEPRIVHVDGRPPLRGVDPRWLRQASPAMMPLRSTRATA